MEMFIYGHYTFEEFCAVYDDILYRDVNAYVKENQQALTEKEGWDLSYTDTEMVQPSTMA